MKYSAKLRLLFFCLMLPFLLPAQSVTFYEIHAPKKISPAVTAHIILHDAERKDFSISGFVTLGEYKQFLESCRKDSGEAWYGKHLPDSSMCSRSSWQKYISDTSFNRKPAAGISWDNALEYCRWKTISETKNQPIKYLYRLPDASEWLQACDYLDSMKISHDMNKSYSDWTITAMDEMMLDTTLRDLYVPVSFESKTEMPVLRRKVMLGNSFLYSLHDKCDFFHLSYYAFEGYRQCSFRLVKVPVLPEESANTPKQDIETALLKYWKIRP